MLVIGCSFKFSGSGNKDLSVCSKCGASVTAGFIHIRLVVSLGAASGSCLCLCVDGIDKPLHAFVEALLRNGTACLNVPSAICDVVKLKGVHNLGRLKCKV